MNKAVYLALILLISCSSREKKDGSVHVFSNVDQSVKTQLAGLLADYFALNKTLIEDDLAAAVSAATSFSQTANKFDISQLNPEQLDFFLVHLTDLKSALESLSERTNINDARADLAAVSEAMYALVKAFHPNESTLYYQYCPMARDNKGANWLSSTKEVINPYMGQMMLACGRTQETIE